MRNRTSLFEKYLGEVTLNKTPQKQKHDRRASRMFIDFFGKGRVVESLNRRDWDRFISSRSDPARPCSKHLMRKWWKRGEKLAGLKPVAWRGWHSLRRKFATDMRAVLPLRDLCDAGGWRDAQTVLKCYQQPDEDLIRAALDGRGDPNPDPNRQDNRQEDLA